MSCRLCGGQGHNRRTCRDRSTGRVYYVQASRGDDGGDGSMERPLATIAEAIRRCSEGQPGTIVLGAEHIEASIEFAEDET